MYLTYGFKEKLFTNLYLIGVCLFVAIFLPHFTKLVDKIEKKFEFMSGKLFLGKLGRFVPQLAFNLVVLVMFLVGHVVHENDLARIGGPLGVAVLTDLFLIVYNKINLYSYYKKGWQKWAI